MMMRSISLLSILVLSSFAGLAGCGGGGGPDAGVGPDLSVRRSTDMALHGPNGTASFAGDVKPILQSRGCFAHHMTSTWNPVETLTSNADIVKFLTTTKTEECKAGGFTFVKTGDATNSFLYQKVLGTFATACGGDTGAQMPLDGPYLFDYELATIKQWIMEGANNN
jgi:hypothetical protein